MSKPMLDAFKALALTAEVKHYQDKYMDNGLKPIESFVTDIRQNLVSWAFNPKSKTTYYLTRNYWYAFELDPSKFITMRRFNLVDNTELTDFGNLDSLSYIGKSLLKNEENIGKRVAVI